MCEAVEGKILDVSMLASRPLRAQSPEHLSGGPPKAVRLKDAEGLRAYRKTTDWSRPTDG